MRDEHVAPFTIVIFVLGLLCGIAIGGSVGKQIMKDQAIERGYAQYRTDTGEWTWKCDLEKIN